MINNEFFITSLIVVLIPGTGVIYTISMGLFQGWKASILAAIGCTTGIIPHLLAAILGLATLLHMSAIAFQIVKFIGVAYLLYLAWSMWRDTGVLQLSEKENKLNARSIITKGFLINILNPKLSLFFLAFLPQFVPTQTQTPTLHMFMLSGIFMGMTLLVFILYGLFANSMRTYIIHSPKIMKRIQRSFAMVFAALGMKLAMAER
jgi:threonine/homoserine/homoserine lactone efflux protein